VLADEPGWCGSARTSGGSPGRPFAGERHEDVLDLRRGGAPLPCNLVARVGRLSGIEYHPVPQRNERLS
jgi:hypothetical protein